MKKAIHNAIVEYWARGLTVATASHQFNTLVCRIHGVTLDQVKQNEVEGHNECERQFNLDVFNQHAFIFQPF